MEKYLGKEIVNAAAREAYLKDNCDACEQKGYMKPYTPAELQGLKENLVNLSIKIMELEAEKKAAVATINGKLKPLLEQRNQMVGNIKAKSEYVTEICYKFTDQLTKETGYYNADGDLIECRPATADELQPTIFATLRQKEDSQSQTLNS